MKHILFLFFLLPAALMVKAQHVVRYDLYVNDTTVSFGGKPKRAIAVNGQIPMPTLTFTEGDTAEIYVHNLMNEETSLHWHGIFLPNREDGVPYLTQMPIAPHTTYMYRFPIIQHGTHWYHSHTGLQEQIGMYGSLILKKRATDKGFRKGIDDLPEVPLILSEWTNLKPENVHRMLHNASDWFAIKKGATQSYAEAIRAGHFTTKVKNEWKRMLAMDVSDVYYNSYMFNAQKELQLLQFKAGDKVRLRISNGGASTYFWLRYAGGKITVVANDGNDVKPVEADRLIIAVSETYDIVVTIPENGKAFELLATSEDRVGSASILLGNGTPQRAMPLPRLKYFEGMAMMNDMMKMNGNLDDMGMNMSLNQMDMNVVMYPEITGGSNKGSMPEMNMNQDHAQHNQYNPNALSDIVTLNYAMLASPDKTSLPENTPVKELRFTLTGNMNRYVWSIDNKVVSEDDRILIKKGEIVRMIIYNNSMMRHPMHLHGHDFRVLNGKGDHAPLKNIIDIMPMETDTLEFLANEDGDWFFHCHILYHMMSGMGRVFTYEHSPANPYISNTRKAERLFKKDDRAFHPMAQIGIESNGSDGEFMLMGTRYQFQTEWRIGTNEEMGYESESHFGRYFGRMQFLFPYVGWDYRHRKDGKENTKDDRQVFCAGVQYTLPMLMIADLRLDHAGNIRFQLSREDIPVTSRLRLNAMVNSDFEYMAGLRYILTRNFSLSTHYDSDMMWGAGFTIVY